MNREWEDILRRWGSPVTVTTGEISTDTRAFLQPVLDRGEQLEPSPLGLRLEERWLYLGSVRVQLRPRESVVTWRGGSFQVVSAREVGDGHHVWAILRRRDGSQ